MQFNIQKSGSTPLHMQLLDELRHWIMTGLVNPHERLPGEWELALELEISRATIQKAWQNAEEEGLIYRVPGKGTFIGEPRPKNATTQSIALIVPDFRGTFAVHMLSGVERVLRRRGYQVQLASSEYTLHEENRILRQFQADGVCGAILWGVNAPKENRIGGTIDQLMPIVLIDRPLPGTSLPLVASNHYQGGIQAMKHLLELGHHRIAFLARPHLDLWSVSERYRAYRDALHDAEIESLPPILIGDDQELSSYTAYAQADEATLAPLIEMLVRPDRPTAIFASNDWMAIRAIRAAHSAGLRLPEELSLVGFDNLDVSEYLSPPLTTVAQNTDLLGSEAARRLLALIEGESTLDVLTLVPTQLIIRRSTCARQ
ncbi:MAG: GntR family transcriptional regulator [Anaerolineae bacterium]|nr:GntR family transcriptional regulator [Anaerolineae bacterium]